MKAPERRPRENDPTRRLTFWLIVLVVLVAYLTYFAVWLVTR